jgi:deoxyribonuclease V
MRIRNLHPWDVPYQEAIRIQEGLRSKLEFKRLSAEIRYVAGTDVSFSKNTNTLWAGVVVLGYPELVRVEEKWVKDKSDFPYIPGLLSFREVPILLKALMRLETDPCLILCDGQGIAHPRGVGLASHLGILVDKPTIGCAKTRLVGDFSKVGQRKGHHTPLRHNGFVVGAVVRTRYGVRPLFISPGNKITLGESIEFVLKCCGRYRLPEPTRQAHLLVTGLRRAQEAR